MYWSSPASLSASTTAHRSSTGLACTSGTSFNARPSASTLLKPALTISLTTTRSRAFKSCSTCLSSAASASLRRSRHTYSFTFAVSISFVLLAWLVFDLREDRVHDVRALFEGAHDLHIH